VQRNSGTFSDIECLRFAERIFEESNTFHLYLRAEEKTCISDTCPINGNRG
jgi:hypothetical protein